MESKSGYVVLMSILVLIVTKVDISYGNPQDPNYNEADCISGIESCIYDLTNSSLHITSATGVCGLVDTYLSCIEAISACAWTSSELQQVSDILDNALELYGVNCDSPGNAGTMTDCQIRVESCELRAVLNLYYYVGDSQGVCRIADDFLSCVDDIQSCGIGSNDIEKAKDYLYDELDKYGINCRNSAVAWRKTPWMFILLASFTSHLAIRFIY